MTSKRKASANDTVVPAESENKQSSRKGTFRKVSIKVALIILIMFFGGIALFTTVAVMANANSLRASRTEYNFLREKASDIESEFGEFSVENLGALDIEMRAINPDYVCWIRVDGTNVDYPVVRGANNDQYLKKSFQGEDSIVGTVFMDYRNSGNFVDKYSEDFMPHIIIYGHNLQQGGMFSDLRSLLSRQITEEGKFISLFINDQMLIFEIFSVRLTDVNDPAYYLNFSEPRYFGRFANSVDAPLEATQIITLSTCVKGGSDDNRLIVQGYRLFD